jgi:hypothetical protein
VTKVPKRLASSPKPLCIAHRRAIGGRERAQLFFAADPKVDCVAPIAISPATDSRASRT